MGKKKSVVLMTLITIVLVVLCALVAFPKIPLGKGGIKTWNPIAMQYDLGGEFSGGHYAYYYPNGVITETEYKALTEDEQKEYARHGETSLYLSKDEEDCILVAEGESYVVAEPFKTAFNQAVDTLSARFAERAAHTGSTYKVSIIDDYAIRVDLSAAENSDEQTSETYASNAFTQLASFGELTFSVGGSTVDELTAEDASIKDLIKSVSVKTQYKIAYVKINFTSAGKAMLKDFKANETTTDSNGSQTTNTLDLKVGDTTLLSITSEHINGKNQVEYGVSYDGEVLNAHTLVTLINSAMEKGDIYIADNDATPFRLTAPTNVEIRSYEPVYGDILIWVYVAILVALVALCALAIVKMGGFGVMNAYTSITYTVIAAICFAFITRGVFVVSLESVFVFLAGLALTNLIHSYIYRAIKAEVMQGKTVQSSVKKGYKKTIWTVVDIYAVLLLGGIALLLGVASLNTVACQAIICILAGAFCNLLWGRVINVMLLSASKDKYKYFRFVREDDGDDE